MSALVVQVNASLDSTLVVYIGAHPDDIDIGMSGSLYKDNVNNHPILWIVVTDGGADEGEYYFDSDPVRGWIEQDGLYDVEWVAPDGSKFNRGFYSEDLARKRCGIGGSYQHDYGSLIEYDWKTRVDVKVATSVIKNQMSYDDPFDPTHEILYPDAGLGVKESIYTRQLAKDLAEVIKETVRSNGYRFDLLYINSHAPTEVAENAYEHKDHKITGNAVRKAIDYLHTSYGFGLVSVNWYTIYNPIKPKPGYTRYQEDISMYKSMKSDLCKAVWETAYMDEDTDNMDRAKKVSDTEGYWNDYPNDPGDYEYAVHVDYQMAAGFQDGFESGSFSAWNSLARSSGETASVVTTLAHHGKYSAKFTSNGGGGSEYTYCRKDIPSSADVYLRGYFYVERSGIVENGDRFNFIVLNAGGNKVAYAGWRKNNNGVLKWCLMIRSGTTSVIVYSKSSPSLERWYCIELHWKKGTTTGLGELWVDGVQVCSLTGKDTAYYGDATQVRMGLPLMYYCSSTTVYSDCISVRSSYIGPEA